MISKYFEGIVPELKNPGEKEKVIRDLTEKTIKAYENLMDDLKISEALNEVVNLLNVANKYIEESQPWVLSKEGRVEELGNVMAVLTSTIVTCTKLLSPVLVESSEKVYALFNLTEEQKSYEFTRNFCGFSGNRVEKGAPLFPRLDIAVETNYINSLAK